MIQLNMKELDVIIVQWYETDSNNGVVQYAYDYGMFPCRMFVSFGTLLRKKLEHAACASRKEGWQLH